MFKTMLTNVVQAKPSSHVLALVLGTLGVVGSQFLADPHVTTYIRDHWWMQYVMGIVGALGPALLTYYNARKPMA